MHVCGVEVFPLPQGLEPQVQGPEQELLEPELKPQGQELQKL
jgi:hypothetical protein